MQIWYGLKTDPTVPTNQVDTYVPTADMGADDWSNVMSLRLTLTFKNPLSGEPGQSHNNRLHTGHSRDEQSGSADVRQRGMVLVSSLLLLLVVTMIAITMFHSFGTQERIASNVREKQRALHAAESAQQYAEWWLSMGNGTSPITCAAAVTAPVGQICDTKLADPTKVPWQVSGAETGVIYAPPDMTVSTTVAAGTYYKSPSFYIAQVGLSRRRQDDCLSD